MNDEQRNNMALWVKALRSGDYTQAQQRLHDTKTGGYCCLGVLCDISGESKFDVDGNFLYPDESGNEHIYHESFPPAELMQNFIGIGTNNGNVEVNTGDQDELTIYRKVRVSELNDEWNWNFDQIADALENTFLKTNGEVVA